MDDTPLLACYPHETHSSLVPNPQTMRDRLRNHSAVANATAANKSITELEGFVGLGMKRDALRLARQFLKANPVNVERFCEAINTLLTLADKTRLWRHLVDAAFQKLSKRG